ncbi:hypothetical protein M3Y99_01904600 [Aphelenchoides fujianensis]|nr:hypothetical protein M3Y99_01904600 [Aphelenchoides fujianensis]
MSTTALWTGSTTTNAWNDTLLFGVCNVEVFDSSQKRTVEILLYVGSGFVLFWITLAILINLCCRAVGFTRFLDFMQEVALIVSECVEQRKSSFMRHPSFVLTAALIQAIFSITLIRGGASRTSGFLAVFSYFWPFAIAAGYTCSVFFTLRDEYINNGVQ